MKINPLRPISISISPNTEKDDVFLALVLLFKPSLWKGNKKRGKNIVNLFEESFKNYLGSKYAFSFNSGRSSLMAIFYALGLKENDEVLLQAFTCNAIVNPIIWSKLKPVFVDCDFNDYNIDINDLKKKITPKSKAVIVQHTFGLPAKIDEIVKICKENNLILIEDCAHSLGAKYKDKKVGLFGDISFFSFSRDKIISSVYGGIVATNNDKLAKKILEYQNTVDYPSYFWCFQQILHPILTNWLILPTYKILGKYIIFLLQRIKILSMAIHKKEKVGKKPNYFPKKLPPALALMAYYQLKKIDKLNNHRQKMALFYREKLKNTSFEMPPEKEQVYLRFTIKHPLAHTILKEGVKKNILLGDWYNSVIAPYDTDISKMHYIFGSCPNAEKLAKITFNLPTHININEKIALRILSFLEKWK
jgi:dTDP-4-amino-4,6-dideoxygalactose transaminase